MRPFLATKIATICAAILMYPAAHALAQSQDKARAVFAGGCFWCMESEFESAEGVISVVSGYTGGQTRDPSYYEVGSGKTGHAEAVEVIYDPSVISYESLLSIFWSNIDPTDAGGQFADRGSQYRSEIFVLNAAQRSAAETSKAEKEKKLGKPVHTRISEAGTFYPAEDYHQDYAKNNPVHYNAYKYGSGRVSRLKELNK